MLETNYKQVLSLGIIFVLFWHVNTLEITLQPPIKCDGESRRWYISNASLYNTAFLWTKSKKIENWKYTSVNAGVFAECAVVEYETSVPIPFFFVMYAHNTEQNIKIHKKICKAVSQDAIQESIQVHNVPFLENIDIFVAGRISTDSTKMHADIKLDLPWYVEIVRKQIEDHVKKSLEDYLSLLVRHSCDQKPQKIKFTFMVKRPKTRRYDITAPSRY